VKGESYFKKRREDYAATKKSYSEDRKSYTMGNPLEAAPKPNFSNAKRKRARPNKAGNSGIRGGSKSD